MALSDLVKGSNSLEILLKSNQTVIGKKFHTFTHILYDIRTILGPEPKIYTEIGSYTGSSAALMLQHTFPTSIVCIDPLNLHPSHYGLTVSQEQVLADNLNNNNRFNNSIQIHKNYSTDAKLLQELRRTGFQTDILFIDGDHSHSGVIADFDNYREFVRPGGYIVFDDYNDSRWSPQVHGAVDSIVNRIKRDELSYEIIGVLPNYQGATPQVTVNDSSNEFIIKVLKC